MGTDGEVPCDVTAGRAGFLQSGVPGLSRIFVVVLSCVQRTETGALLHTTLQYIIVVLKPSKDDK